MSTRSLFLAASALALAGLLSAAEAPKFEKLPHKVSSLGACVSDGYVYVYGGHTGVTHTYSTETTTGKFFRIKLSGGKWEELTSGPAAQGLALVAHKGKIYRVGGMQPRNKPDDKVSDTHSLTSFAAYDPSTKKWQDLTDLPEGRSSHDAVVVGDKLYVFGGWKMNGKGKEPTWHETGLVMDLSKPTKWQTIKQPFSRRALAVESLGGKVYVLGGLTAKGSELRVDVYDPKTEKWSEGPALTNKEEKSMGPGFSPAACVQDGRLYVNLNDGVIYRLSKDGKSWEDTGKVELARVVPRMVAGEKGSLIVLGGNARGEAREVEVITPK